MNTLSQFARPRFRAASVAALLLACCVVGGPAAVLAGDWAHWRGPEHDGISRERNLVTEWSLADGKNVLWSSETGGRATPIVLGGRVFLNCRTPEDVNDPEQKIHAQEQVVCWDAETGEEVWRDRFNVFQTDIPAPRVGWASMAGDTETGYVYVHSVSGLFRCYTNDGKIVWEHSLFEDFGKISGYGGRTQTPIVDEDRVIVSFLALNWGDTAKPPPKQTYYAFDKYTGDLLWTSAPGGKPYDTNYSAPIVRVIDGVRTLIGGNSDGGIYAIHARTGEPLWGFRMSKRGLNASPVIEENRIYISHGEDNIDNAEFGRIQCIDATGRGDVTDTHSLWRVDGIKAGYASLLVKDGILYVVSDTGQLHAFDSRTGDELWQHNLGTVGKGSPVWADGKLYVMEVNGNVHVLEPSRESCKTVSHERLAAAAGEGLDEIYASPAIADGRIFLVTRDRTICLGRQGVAPTSDRVPPLAPEKPLEQEPALAQLVPYEVSLAAGERQEYQLRIFDKNGRLIRAVKPELSLGDGLDGVTAQGATLNVGELAAGRAGKITGEFAGLTASARVRAFPELPWQWDFTGYEGKRVPATWINAFLKLQPAEVEGETVLRGGAGKGRPSAYVWLGPADMTGYTVQADVMLKEQRRRLPSVGITVNRYNLILQGNIGKLGVQSWAPHKRMAKQVRFRSDPDIWYTMKLQVDIDDDGAHVRGKVWPRGESEPEAWSIEQLDPHPNTQGSPGLYMYRLADLYYDNVIVTKKEE
ncbi:MAG: serine/threonine protein kinase [Planctomycetota bacterium]|nr:MAG: serine/threonine protein kinase [Planctomycetota bacterium]REJ87524.1 MAG: serine/threonine protein kinase [Planctomycetota bacterium]